MLEKARGQYNLDYPEAFQGTPDTDNKVECIVHLQLISDSLRSIHLTKIDVECVERPQILMKFRVSRPNTMAGKPLPFAEGRQRT